MYIHVPPPPHTWRAPQWTHPYNRVHLRGCDLLGSLDGAHDLLLMLRTRRWGHAPEEQDVYSLKHSRSHQWPHLLWQVRQHLSTDAVQSLHDFSLREERKMRSEHGGKRCGAVRTQDGKRGLPVCAFQCSAHRTFHSTRREDKAHVKLHSVPAVHKVYTLAFICVCVCVCVYIYIYIYMHSTQVYTH